MFLHLRTRLTLWYSLVLTGALLLFGGTLYVVVYQTVFLSVQNDIRGPANISANQWQRATFDPTSSTPSPCLKPQGQFPRQNSNGFRPTFYFACFDARGNYIQGSAHGDGNQANGQVPANFAQNSLARQALQALDGRASNTLSSSTAGPIYRYAVVVHNSQGNGILGVIQLGEPIQGQVRTLQDLLFALILIGVLTLIAAAFGGLFLANRALVPARLALERQQRFIADASHELRTPLTLMRADAEVLLRGHPLDEDAVLLEDIVAEATHMTTLATNMLSLARLDAGRQHQEHDVVDLRDITTHVIQRANALASQQQVTLRTNSSAPVLIIGDAMLLEQATLVILDNAIKYNHAGGSVTITTCVENEHAQLVIQDTGIGIAANDLAHIGERFYRVDKARSREAGGTGLGFSIARSIVNSHNGTIDLQSIEGEGTTVTITLPLARRTKQS